MARGSDELESHRAEGDPTPQAGVGPALNNPRANLTLPIVCVGGANLDIKFRTASSLRFHDSNPVRSSRNLGGVARNISENLARLGQSVALISRLGSDENAKPLFDFLRKREFPLEGISTSEFSSTASYTAVIDPLGELVLAFSEMGIYDEITPELLNESLKRLFHHTPTLRIVADTNLPVESLNWLVSRPSSSEPACASFAEDSEIWLVSACPSKAPRIASLLLSLQRERTPPLASLCGIILNKRELFEMARDLGVHVPTSPNLGRGLLESTGYHVFSVISKLFENSFQNLIVTCGSDGVFLQTRKDSRFFEILNTPKILVKDVTGAGDAFVAGVFYGLSKSSLIEHAIPYGLAASRLTVQTDETVYSGMNSSVLDAEAQIEFFKESRME